MKCILYTSAYHTSPPMQPIHKKYIYIHREELRYCTMMHDISSPDTSRWAACQGLGLWPGRLKPVGMLFLYFSLTMYKTSWVFAEKPSYTMLHKKPYLWHFYFRHFGWLRKFYPNHLWVTLDSCIGSWWVMVGPDGLISVPTRHRPSWGAYFLHIWVWVKIRYPNNWMVNTTLD